MEEKSKIISTQSLCLIGKRRLSIAEKNIDCCLNANEALIEILVCGICGSDIELVNENSLTSNNYNVLGHEIVGKVVALGDNCISSISIGEKVIIGPNINCGECEQCVKGNYNLCENLKTIGRRNIDGGFQTFLKVPISQCYRKSDALEDTTAILTEPIAVCLHAIDIAEFQKGMNVAVIGCGTVGLLLIKLLKSFGAKMIYAYDIRQITLKFAKSFGADIIKNDLDDFEVAVMGSTENKGVDMVFEASGEFSNIGNSIKFVKAGSRIIVLSRPNAKCSLELSCLDLFKKEVDIKFVRGYNKSFGKAVQIISENLEVSSIITHKFGFDKIIEYLQNNEKYSNEVIKAVFLPNDKMANISYEKG